MFHRKDLTNSSTGTSSICMSDRSRVLSSSLSFKLLFPTDTGILSINRWWQSISQTRMLNYNSKVNLGCSKRSEQAPQNQKRKRPQLSLDAKKALLSKADRSKRTDDREVGDIKLTGFTIQFKGLTPKLGRYKYPTIS